MRFLHFITLAQKIFRKRGCNFTWSFRKVMCSKSVWIVYVTSIMRGISYTWFMRLFIFCSKIIFDQKLFFYYCDKFDYPGSMVYSSYFVTKSFLTKDYFLIAVLDLTTLGPLHTLSWSWIKFSYFLHDSRAH